MGLDHLIKLQNDLVKKLVLKDRLGKIETIGGADLAYEGDAVFSSIIVLDYGTLEILDKITVKTRTDFPYIPTFLSFREIEPIKDALKALRINPDILLIDGHGIAHPRRMGIASHLGVLLNIATIGVAKRLLCGDIKGKMELGKALPIIRNKEQVGWAVKTKKGTNPIYISPGNRVSLDSSLKIVLHCIKKHKLPEPSRLAHESATKAKRGDKV
ncbi:MAG: endonuclease V [Candidatus Hydrothermarchaeales archaeon]